MKTKRPLVITVLCILMVVATVSFLVQDLPRGHFVPPWVPVYLLLSGVITLGCAAGMWMMRRWSVYLYAFLVAQAAILGFALFGIFSLRGLAARVLVVMVSFYFICGRSNRQAEQECEVGSAPG
jgi:uncharacterized membrane protein (DUF2068 family)